jgi:predicted transcriptional regulator
MSQFPYEISKAVEGLDNEHRQRILLILNEAEKLSFSEISEKVGISRPLLANHLRKLGSTLLIDHFYEHEVGNEEFSYYRISPFGKALIGNIFGTLYFRQLETEITLTCIQIKTKETSAALTTQLKSNTKTPQVEASSEEKGKTTINIA